MNLPWCTCKNWRKTSNAPNRRTVTQPSLHSNKVMLYVLWAFRWQATCRGNCRAETTKTTSAFHS